MSLISTMSVGLQPVSYALSSLLLGRGIVQPWSLFLICGLMLVTMMVLTAVPRDFRQAEDHPLWQVADSRNMRDPLELEANSID